MTAQEPLRKTLSCGVFAALLMLAGCGEEQGPAEKAGEQIDEAMQDAADGAEDAAEAAGDAIEEAADEVEDATD